MTIKSSRKKSGSRAAKATNRKNSKATAPKQPGTTKLALLVAHLSAPGGATIAELCKATGWQPHSVRGGLAGALRRKGHVIRSEKEGGQRRYRIEEPVTWSCFGQVVTFTITRIRRLQSNAVHKMRL